MDSPKERSDDQWIMIKRGRNISSLNQNFDCVHAWKVFFSSIQQRIRRMEEDGTTIDRSEIVMSKIPFLVLRKKQNTRTDWPAIVFSHSASQGYSFIQFSGEEDLRRDPRQTLASAGFNDHLYYFETLDVEDGYLQGYWSAVPNPGYPIWPPRPNAEGTSWGWESVTPNMTVEVSRSVSLRFFSNTHVLTWSSRWAGKAP